MHPAYARGHRAHFTRRISSPTPQARLFHTPRLSDRLSPPCLPHRSHPPTPLRAHAANVLRAAHCARCSHLLPTPRTHVSSVHRSCPISCPFPPPNRPRPRPHPPLARPALYSSRTRSRCTYCYQRAWSTISSLPPSSNTRAPYRLSSRAPGSRHEHTAHALLCTTDTRAFTHTHTKTSQTPRTNPAPPPHLLDFPPPLPLPCSPAPAAPHPQLVHRAYTARESHSHTALMHTCHVL